MGGNTRGTRRPFTRQELELAIRLHDEQGVVWDDIARRIGCVSSSLQSTVCYFRKGRWRPAERRPRVEAFRKELERLVVEEGVTWPRDLARRMQTYPQNITMHLLRIGLDTEIRREIRREFAARDRMERAA